MPLFATTILLSAFLLFLVQPIIAKEILPWFGGGSAVWTVCLAFFQVVLLAGYAYADAITRWLPPRRQALLHAALLAISLAWLPIIPHASLAPSGDTDAAARILVLLAATIGLPYFLLSSTGPLLQKWIAPRFAQHSVYRLFALSNLGSLVGLLAYPFAIEPTTGTTLQSMLWSAGYVAFAALCAYEAWQAATGAAATPAEPDTPRAPATAAAGAGPAAAKGAPPRPPAWLDIALWVALAALGSAVLLAGTSHITQNVAAVPFFWVVPLALYLLSFIVAFEARGRFAGGAARDAAASPPRSTLYPRRSATLVAMVLAVLMAAGLSADSGVLDVGIAVPLYCAGIFFGCLFCHGELALRRPEPGHLTLYYLMIALGGAIGGILTGLAAPRLLSFNAELPLTLFSLCAIAILTVSSGPSLRAGWRATLLLSAIGGTILSAYYGLAYRGFIRHDLIAARRNFYGTLRVREQGTGDERIRRLLHGVILHGEEPLAGTDRLRPGTYYAPSSGVGLAIASVQDRPGVAMRLGVVGLGVGTLSAYGRRGDSVHFYEIDPDVVSIARRYFDYLRHARAPVTVTLGDARLSLARELAKDGPGRFDVLAIDAFSGDSIPVHLLTREAIQLYAQTIADDGIIAVHISNRFLDLKPVLANIAQDLRLPARIVDDRPEDRSKASTTSWVLIAKQAAALDAPRLAGRAEVLAPDDRRVLWTDQFNNLLGVLKAHPGIELAALAAEARERLRRK